MRDDDMAAHPAPGIITAHVLPPGRFYPGAQHRYLIHRRPGPAAGPLPLILVLDGGWLFLDGAAGSTRLTGVLDELMASGEIPEAVTVLIDPPSSPAAAPAQQARWERAFQYDSLSRRFVDFLFEELVPAVAAQHPLTDRAEERLVIGVSSGAVGAFVAAWHRPDLIGRVMAAIGTFVAMRGADTLAGLVRRTEAKPLKVWLEAGLLDHVTPEAPWGTHAAGSWPVASRTLQDALRFAGYDSTLVLGEGGHDLEHLGAVLPEALRWIWGDAAAARSEWRLVEEAVGGMAARADGSIVTQAPATAFARGNEGDVYTADSSGLVRLGDEVVAEGFPATELLWTGDGHLHGIVGDRLGTIDLVTGAASWVALGAAEPTGLGMTTDRAQLLVTDGRTRHQWSFLRDAAGLPTAPEPYFRIEDLDDQPGATAVAVDTDGWVYFATALGIQVCEPIGRVARILANPEPTGRPTALAFGGPTWNDLHVLQNGRLFVRTLEARGAHPSAPVTPPPPAL